MVLEKRLASGPLQGGELQGCTLVVSRYAGIAVFHGLIMALTFDACKPLKTRGGGRGSKPTLCIPNRERVKRIYQLVTDEMQVILPELRIAPRRCSMSASAMMRSLRSSRVENN